MREEYREYKPVPAGKAFGWLGGTALVFGLITLWLGVFTTAEYERDIVTRYGAFHRVAGPGLNWKLPWVDSIGNTFDMRVVSDKFENMEAYSSDQQLAKIDVSVTFRPRESKLQTFYNDYRDTVSFVDRVLRRYVPADTKIVFGDFTAVSAIKEREKFNLDLKTRIITHLGADPVVEVVSVNVEDIEYSKIYNDTVEARMKSEVEVLKLRQELEKEKVNADILRTQADATAYQTKTLGDAEAQRIEAKGKALANSPRYIEMIQAEKWDGRLPQTVLPSTAVPLINGLSGPK